MFDIMIQRNWDSGFILGADPIWIHRHYEDSKESPYHFHMLFSLGWWFLEIRIGRDFIERDN